MARKTRSVMGGAPTVTRAELISQVQRGELSPSDAESQATELGFPPLLNTPNPAAFELNKEPYWSVPMALAWIMTRREEPVRAMCDSWRAQNEFWVAREWALPGGPVHTGHMIQTHGPAGLLDLRVSAAAWARDKKLHLIVSADDAMTALIAALRAGNIEASGLPSPSALRAPLPAQAWIDLGLNDEDGHVVARGEHGSDARYAKLLLAPSAVQRKWRGTSKTETATALGEANAIRSLTKMLLENNNLAREAALAHCQKKHCISKRGFQQRVWPEARAKSGLSKRAPPGRKR